MGFAGHSRDAVTSRLRLRGYNYRAPGSYYVTMVTQDRQCLFGQVIEDDVHPSPADVAIDALWHSVSQRFPVVLLDAWVLMPNHLHAIVQVPATEEGSIHPDAPHLSEVIHWFKTRSTVVYGQGVRNHGWPRYRERL